MRWIVPALALGALALGACGGPKVPQHAGYKSEKTKPWKKPKVLRLDKKSEARADGELSYPAMRRARWFAIDLPSQGELALRVEIVPPGEATNEEFDLAFEVLDPGYRVISKADLEEDDAYELSKTRTLRDLAAGRYYLHFYLQGRMDTAEFEVQAAFQSTAPAERSSNFPAEVATLPTLPAVPLKDDTPARYKPQSAVTKVIRRRPREKTVEAAAPVATVSARIVGVAVVSGGTQITIGRGTASGASESMKARLKGISGTFSISCGENTCRAVVSATPDQIKAAGGTVTLVP